MSKTPTLYDLMLAELWELEKDKDIYRYDNLDNLSSRTSEMTRILKFDDTVEEITTETIFTGLHLDYGDSDFKKLFLQHFLNREIKWQTLELFQSKIAATFLMNQDTLNFYYSELDRLLKRANVSDSQNNGTNESESITTGNNTSQTNNVSDNRSISASMPQDQYNIDVENHIAHTADSNDVSKNKNVSETNANNNTSQKNTGLNNASSQSVSNMYDIAYLREVKAYIQNVLDDFDTNCFSQTW